MRTSEPTTLRSGRDLAMIARCLLLARAQGVEPVQVAERVYGLARRTAHIPEILRSAVDTATTLAGDPGAELFSARAVAAEFAAATRELSLLGKLSALRVPANVAVPFISARTRFSFVGEGQKIPAAKPTFGTTALLKPKSIKGLAVIARELANSSEAEDVLQRVMGDGAVEGSDVALLDGIAADATRPASLVALADEIYSGAAATDVAGIDNLLRTMTAHLLSLGGGLRRAAWLTSSAIAVGLAAMRDDAGGLAYPGLGAAGGVLLGLPLHASDYAAADTLVLVDGSALVVADESVATIAVSDAAMIYMSDDAASHPVSIFATDSLALRVTRELNWDLLGARAVAATGLALPEGTANTA